MDTPLSVLMITSEWPTPDSPFRVPFIVRQVEFLRRANLDIDVFHFRGAQNPANYLRAWREVRKKISRKPYDLIHAQWGQSGLLALPKRIPLVITFRGDDLEGIVGDNGKYTLAGYLLRALSFLVAKQADALIVVSAGLKRRLPKRHAEVIPSGLDFDRMPLISKVEARERLGLPPDKRFVLFACNPEQARKRYPLAKQAVSLLDPSLRAELIVAWGVPHSDIPLYMNACDVLIFTSMHEGSPNVVKEALACNLPVVSVIVGDVVERLKQIEGCAVCENDRPATLAAALTRILRSELRVEGRATLIDLDENILVRRTIQIYRSVMNNGLANSRHPRLQSELARGNLKSNN
jgi:glycosyltransferase involved in cell wall biosynthesis